MVYVPCVSPEIDPGYIRRSQSEKLYCMVMGILLVCEKKRNF
jgi:hypothetical protein